MNSELKPKIRFKGFTDDWEQRKLDDMCSIITKQTGFDYSATIKPSLLNEKNDKSYSFIQNKDFSGMNINLDTDFYIPIDVAKKFPKIMIDTPSLLISISGKIGNVGLYDKNKVSFIGGAVGICKLTNPKNGELYVYELESEYGQKYFQSLIKASSHANITVEDIRNINVIQPKDNDEILKISKFLKNVDSLITLHQRKCDKLVELKKSLLEKMFPQNNSVIPEIRFKGFTNDWEQRKFDTLAKVDRGLTYSPNNLANNGIRVLRSSNINDDQFKLYDEDVFVTPNSINIEYANNNDILITSANGSSRLVGKHTIIKGISSGSTVHGGFMLLARPYINSHFLNASMSSSWYKKFIDLYVAGGNGAIGNLSKTDLDNQIVNIPNESEINKIGDLFKNIDNLITLHQCKYDKLNKIRQSLLNDMFI